MTQQNVICPWVVRSEFFRAASKESPDRNAGVLSEAGDLQSRRNGLWRCQNFATIQTQRDVSDLLGMMKTFCQSMMKWGEAWTEGYHPGAPVTREEIKATKMGITKILSYKIKLKSQLNHTPFQLTDMCLAQNGPRSEID